MLVVISNLNGCVDDADDVIFRVHLSSIRLDLEGEHVC